MNDARIEKLSRDVMREVDACQYPVSKEAVVYVALAAAEERGRRRGVEDLQTMLQNAAPHIIGAGHFCLWNCKCGYCAPLQDALASRDSDHVVASGHAEETDREDRRDDRWANPNLEAPRDSGKEGT